MECLFKENSLTVDLYVSLRERVGFYKYSREDVSHALKNTLYNLVVYDKKKDPIGMLRIIGDGKIVFFIKDFIVVPEYQKKGIGSLMFKRIWEYLERHACDNAYLGLMSTENSEGFYEKLGFIKRPSPGLGAGMVMFFKKNQINQ